MRRVDPLTVIAIAAACGIVWFGLECGVDVSPWRMPWAWP